MRLFVRLFVFIIGVIIGWQPFSDGGTGAGGSGGGEGGTQGQGGAEGGTQSQGGGTGATPPAGQTYDQAALDRIVNERLADAQRKTETKTQTERKKAEEAALAEQQKFKELAEQRGTEIETLRGEAEAGTRYAERLNTWCDSEVKDWPAEVKTLDPGKEQLEARLDWIEKSRPLAQKLAALPKVPDTDAGRRNAAPAGTGATGTAGGTGAGADQKKPTYRFTSPGDVSW